MLKMKKQKTLRYTHRLKKLNRIALFPPYLLYCCIPILSLSHFTLFLFHFVFPLSPPLRSASHPSFSVSVYLSDYLYLYAEITVFSLSLSLRSASFLIAIATV
ncbi:hypothetical protein RIF29_42475 [Crotalaria pallida]|uniref:Uncharacterized protein n=1 Tax=Crotalaria pallida TaxID=3830 RepID=A0AAN9HQB4_CROPI